MNRLTIMMVTEICFLLSFTSCGNTQSEGSRKSQDLCANISIEDCNSNEGYRILGAQQYDTAKRCLFPREDVGCTSNFECDDAFTFSKDPCGTKWMFSSGCVPEGWEIISSIPSSPEASAPNWPLCKE